ncbi:hypothetical protein KR009_006055 [Drosophila setifemur]|nr:hypothetical protein KR009_006055 [Drosophila setifemur]
MLRLSSSTYSSICFLVFFNFVWLLLLLTTTAAKPAESAPGNGMQHVTSLVNQKESNHPHQEFDFERNEALATKSVQLQQLYQGILKLPGTDNASIQLEWEGMTERETDDEPVSERITLDDDLELMANGEQHEGSTQTPDTWTRIKLAIPVLEPVKHLLNAVGGGGVNDTHVKTNSHRLIGHHGVHHSNHSSWNVSSPAIETEEDRETAIDSTGFDVLETLGSAGTVLWGILQNLRKLFAASAGNASSASSGGGGGN